MVCLFYETENSFNNELHGFSLDSKLSLEKMADYSSLDSRPTQPNASGINLSHDHDFCLNP